MHRIYSTNPQAAAAPAQQSPKLLLIRKCPDPPRGIEICRDESAGSTYAASKCVTRPRWRIVRYQLTDGRVIREQVFVGSARAFYAFASDELCITCDEVPHRELNLPSPQQLYERRVQQLLRGRSFSSCVYAGMTEYVVE